MNTIELIPDEVLNEYNARPDKVIRLAGGIVNTTFLLEEKNEKLILQRLGQDINPNSVEDAERCARHLVDNDWEAPTAIQTKDGNPFSVDINNNYWRATKHIQSDPSPPTSLDTETLEATGYMLARWHNTMSTLRYNPKHSIPYFHDTQHHANKLRGNTEKLGDCVPRIITNFILNSYDNLEQPPEQPTQLIHGDPKIANILFRNGKPLTLIDFDTIMAGTVWTDIGDMLRSIVSKDMGNDPTKIEAVAKGYYDQARPEMRQPDFMTNSIRALKLISLELAMRYLNDIVDDYYFSWDEEQYISRADNHIARAALHADIVLNLTNYGV